MSISFSVSNTLAAAERLNPELNSFLSIERERVVTPSLGDRKCE
jgi:hypothetical protein